MGYIEFNAIITPLEVGRDVLVAELSEIGFESFVDVEDGVNAYIQTSEFDEISMKNLHIFQNSEFAITYSIKTIEDQNWNAEWEKSFDPINVDNRCVIRAQFHDKIDNIEYDIIIDPKMSFGTGHHETTHLMIERLLDMDLEELNVMDMGCGTGVLAILAKMRNAAYVEAIDIDEWAYNNSIENIRNNNCSDIVVQLGGAEKLGATMYDVFIANINRNILINDMANYVERLSKSGSLLLSGFFSSDQELIIKEALSYGMKKVHSETKNDWMMIHLIKE